MNLLQVILGRSCLFCGRTVDIRSAGLCPECAAAVEELSLAVPPEEITPAVSLFRYRGPVRTGLHRFKYQGYSALGIACGRMLAERFRLLGAAADVVTCVPRARDGMRRMYNQSAVIARRFAGDLGLPFDPHLLRKRTGARTQPECRDRRSRMRNAERSYRVGPSRRDLKGKTVVLVDDLYTSGATARVCEKMLKKRGAARVLVYTAMKAVPGSRMLVLSHAYTHVHYALGDEAPYRGRRFRVKKELR